MCGRTPRCRGCRSYTCRLLFAFNGIRVYRQTFFFLSCKLLFSCWSSRCLSRWSKMISGVADVLRIWCSSSHRGTGYGFNRTPSVGGVTTKFSKSLNLKTWKTAIKEMQSFRAAGAGCVGCICCYSPLLWFPITISFTYFYCKLLVMGVTPPEILCLLRKLLTEMPQSKLLRAAESYSTGMKHWVDSPD